MPVLLCCCWSGFAETSLGDSEFFEGKRFYTIAESGQNLNIEFKGDAHHLPETILTLRTQRENGQTFYEIESWLTAADVQRFALIRRELQKDLADNQTAARRTNGVILN